MATPAPSARTGPFSPALQALCFVGCAGVALVRARLAGTLRVDQAALPLAWQLALGLALGLCLLGAGLAWLRAVRDSTAPLRALLPGALLLQLCAALALPLTSNDLFSNLAYGRMVRLGLDPYLLAPGALPVADPFRALVGERWLGTPIAYGPIVVALDALCAGGTSVLAAMVRLKVASLLLAVLAVLATYRLCKAHFAEGEAGRAFLFVACNPLFAWELAGQAHNDTLLVLSLLGFAAAALAGRELLAVAALALGLYSKLAVAPALGLYLLYIARSGGVRAVLRASALALGTALAGAVLFAPFWHGFATFAAPLEASIGNAGRHARSFADLLYWAAWPLGARAQGLVMAACRLLGGALLAGFALLAASRVRTLNDVLRDSLRFFLLYDLVASPWFQPWYATWLLPLALLLDAGLRETLARYSLWTVLQYALPIDPVGTAVVNVLTLRRLGLRGLLGGAGAGAETGSAR